MDGGKKELISEEKLNTTQVNTSTNSIPGFDAASKVRKPVDTNLNPLIRCNSKPIQYGDTSINSICTDNPAWSPGDCLFLGNYEGKFIRKKCITSSLVIVSIFQKRNYLSHVLGPSTNKRSQDQKDYC